MTEIDNKLSKRVSSLFAFGALPSGFIALVGDFFTPKGGAIAVGVLGVFALIFLIYLITYLSASDGAGKKPWWFQLTSNDKDINWIWKPKSPFSSHGVHVLIVVVIVCFFSANKSLASVNKTGYLAKNLDSISLAQEQLGVTQQILIETQKTSKEVGELNKKADNFKKENSDDPQKELINLGFRWSEEGLWHAVLDKDVKAVNLYMKAGMSPRHSGNIVLEALKAGDLSMISALAIGTHKPLPLNNNGNITVFRDKHCDDIFVERIDIREEIKKEGNSYTKVSVGDKLKHDKYSELIINASSKADSSVKVLLKKVCATDEFLEVVKKKNDSAQSDSKINPSAEKANTAKYWSSVYKLLS